MDADADHRDRSDGPDDDRPDPAQAAPSTGGRSWSTARGLAALGVVAVTAAVVVGVRTGRDEATLPVAPPAAETTTPTTSVARSQTAAVAPTPEQDARLRVAFATNVGADFARGYDGFGPALLASCRMMRQADPPDPERQDALTIRRFAEAGARLTASEAALVLQIMRGEYCPIDG